MCKCATIIFSSFTYKTLSICSTYPSRRTAKEWRENNPKLEGNIRDYTDILHLVVLSNLEVLNASMIENNIGQKDRLEKLNETAKRQITILASDNNIIGITKLDNQKLIGGANE